MITSSRKERAAAIRVPRESVDIMSVRYDVLICAIGNVDFKRFINSVLRRYIIA